MRVDELRSLLQDLESLTGAELSKKNRRALAAARAKLRRERAMLPKGDPRISKEELELLAEADLRFAALLR